MIIQRTKSAVPVRTIVTIAAAESAEPENAVARATNSVISRVLIFYVGSVFLVVCIIPWNSNAIETPYVSALETLGIPAAANIMNAVVLTAVLSALNSGLYWGKGFSNFAPGCITLSILPPIAAGQSMREALGQLEAAIEGEVARLTATSPQNDSLSHQEPDA